MKKTLCLLLALALCLGLALPAAAASEPADEQLKAVTLKVKKTLGIADDYTEFNGKKFPKDIILSFVSAAKTNKIELELSSISQNSNWATRTDTPSGRYTQVSADELFKSLTK